MARRRCRWFCSLKVRLRGARVVVYSAIGYVDSSKECSGRLQSVGVNSSNEVAARRSRTAAGRGSHGSAGILFFARHEPGKFCIWRFCSNGKASSASGPFRGHSEASTTIIVARHQEAAGASWPLYGETRDAKSDTWAVELTVVIFLFVELVSANSIQVARYLTKGEVTLLWWQLGNGIRCGMGMGIGLLDACGEVQIGLVLVWSGPVQCGPCHCLVPLCRAKPSQRLRSNAKCL